MPLSGLPSTGEPGRVLVVDDEPNNLVAVEAILAPLGLEVLLARSVDEALRLLLKAAPSVLLLDVQMPGVDGFEAAQMIRERPSTAHVPIIFLTAHNEQSQKVSQGYSLGAVDFLFKPLDAAILRSKVMVFVELERRTQRLKNEEAHLGEQRAGLERELQRHQAAVELAAKAAELERANRRLAAITDAFEKYLESADWSATAARLLELAIAESGSEAGCLGTLVPGVGVRLWAQQRWVPAPADASETDRAAVVFGGVGEQSATPSAIRGLFLDGAGVVELAPGDPRREVLGGSSRGPLVAVPIRLGGDVDGFIAVHRFDAYAAGERAALEALGRSASVLHQSEARRRREGELGEQLRQSQKMEAVGTLAGGVAHDFNNLLTVINGYADFVRTDPALPAKLTEDLDMIKHSGQRAAALTRQLLAFSRHQVLDLRAIDVAEVLRESQKMYLRLLGEDVVLSYSATGAPWNVMADAGQVEQIVLNLLVNARDAMPEGGKIILEVSNHALDAAYDQYYPETFRAGDYVMIAVTDTGSGIPPEVRPHIFEPFYTTKERGKGTGLGLSTVYGIVRQMQGHIWVYSEIGSGTTLKVFLPRVKEAPVAREVSTEAQLVGHETVLIVEDDPVLTRLCRRMLESGGYRVLCAGTREEAIELHDAHPEIALLLVDVVLKGGTGPRLVEELRARRAGLRTLFMSGYTQHASLERGDLADGVSFIQKPFSRADLLDRVRRRIDEPLVESDAA